MNKLTNSRKVILDTSALLALLNKETGWEIVQSVIPKAIMSSVNTAEAIGFLMQRKKLSLEEAKHLIHLFTTEIIDFTLEQSCIAAELLENTKEYGLSLGDRACIGLGLTSGHAIYTTDKIWKDLKIDNINIILIR